MIITDEHLSEEQLILLTEDNHTPSEGETIPFYQFINENLLEKSKSNSVLGLLDINGEKEVDQNHRRLSTFSNIKFSAVSDLINSTMSTCSPQVSNYRVYWSYPQ